MDYREEFNPVLTMDLLGQLITTADRLHDRDLVAIARRITTQLYREGSERPPRPTSTTPPDPADTGHDDPEGA